MKRLISPTGSSFRDLTLRYDVSTGTVTFRQQAFVALLEANGLDARAVLADPQQQRELIAEWYRQHIATGGRPDPVMEFVGKHLGMDITEH